MMKLKIGTDIVRVRKKVPFIFTNSHFIKQRSGDIEIDSSFFEIQVPNIRRYKLKLENGYWSFIKYKPLNLIHLSAFTDDDFGDEDLASLSNISDNAIFMILESPHEKEFDENFNPIAPAQDSTGLNIKTYIENVLTDVTKLQSYTNGIYDFCLINPVRSQTSLFYLHKQPLSKNRVLRNKIWKYLWKDSIKQQDLLNILNTPHYTNKIVINACTSPIKHNLSNFLKEHNICFFTINHPSGWFSIVNRSVKKDHIMICPKCKNSIPNVSYKCCYCGLKFNKKK